MGDEELLNEDDEQQVKATQPVIDVATSGNIALEAHIKRLQDALAKRMNPMFDPTLMALSAGFLKPTKTGGFGESLGYALEGVSTAQEQERSRKSEVEKLQLELALKEHGLKNQQEAQKMLSQYIKNRGIPQTTLTQSPEPQSADTATPSAQGDTSEKIKVSPEKAVKVVNAIGPQAFYKMHLDPDFIMLLSQKDPKTGALAQKFYENEQAIVKLDQRERELKIREKESGFREREVGQKELDTLERQNPFDPATTIRIPRNKVAEFDSVASQGNPIEMSKFLAKTGIPGYFGKTFGEQGVEGFKPPPTQSEREIEKLRKEEDIKADAEIDKTARESMFLTQKKATDVMIPEATQILKFAKDKSGKNAFGYLAGRGLLPAVVNLVSEGFSVGNYKIGLPEIRETLKLADPNFTEADLKAAQALKQNLTRLELAVAEARKEGTVTNFERTLFASLSPLKTDTPEVAAFKAEIIINRGIMDDLTAKKYMEWKEKNKGKYVSDFRNSKEYTNLRRHYNNQIDKIRKNYGFDMVPPLSSIPENEQL